MARSVEKKIHSDGPSSGSCVSFYSDIALDDDPKPSVKTLQIDDAALAQVQTRPKSTFVKQHAGFGLVNFFTLKVLFFDVFITIGDVVSDFAQALALFNSKSEKTLTGETWIYGLVSMVVIWLPGVVCAIHIISMYRYKWSAKRTIAYALLSILFYPIIPAVLYIYMLWVSPRDLTTPFHSNVNSRRASKASQWIEDQVDKFATNNQNPRTKDASQITFADVEKAAIMAHAIAGGIESPIQFILQLWLILNGKIGKPWEMTGYLNHLDWQGNAIYFPTTALISLIFSVLSMVKAAVEFNIIGVHIRGVSDGQKFLDFSVLVMDHMPFLSTAGFFRITSIAFLLTYINQFAFVPIMVLWLGNLIIGSTTFKLQRLPLWLISFVSVFLPICFPVRDLNDENKTSMIEMQYATFLGQSIASVVVFIPSLIFVACQINMMPGWNYDSNVILTNPEFNTFTGILCSVGLLNVLLSVHPRWIELIKSCVRFITEIDDDDEDAVDGKASPGRVQKLKQRFRSASGDVQDNSPVFYVGGSKDPNIEMFYSDRISNQANKAIRKLSIKKKDQVQPQSSSGKKEAEPKILLRRVTPKSERIETEFTKATNKAPWVKIKRILFGFLFCGLVFAPVYVPAAIFHDVKPDPAYVYFIANKTSIKIMQAIPLNTPKDVKGCLFPANMTRTAMRKICDNRDDCCTSTITYVYRSEWPSCKETGCYRSSSAIIVIDDNECNNNDNCYRPSYPLTDLSFDTGIPMLLVQKVDAVKLHDVFNKITALKHSKNLEFGVAKANSTVPMPMFQCDAKGNDPEKCLPKEGTELIGTDGRINGKQSRKITCFWGRGKCDGYKSINVVQSQNFCNEELVFTYFCKSSINHFWYNLDLEQEYPRIKLESNMTIERSFNVRSSYDGRFECLNEENVKHCDKGKLHKPIWSRCTEPSESGYKRRYCKLNDHCLIEEFKISKYYKNTCTAEQEGNQMM